ncbi:DUF6884 domain-containing protein [Anabaena azotica]|uniref:tRNA-guanine transglycosylase n=1 Tax=Anabaena azotica FACHB-119 TaxID=947527 RepID=A0ABR8DFD1_9NOST|nr:DUF6884 domain-containing protein [Anabaena azotica]MBD2505100.1 hypothetical protein [Anabaena azotica FACHB-119]
MTSNNFHKTKYYAVIGNRDHIKYQGEKRPFWEFLDTQPDGYLISLAYLPIPFALPNTPKIGDCGAWSYKAEKLPKLGKNLVTPEWAISQYQLYFSPDDLVIAPDHMLIPLPGTDLDSRRQFNIESAKRFLPLAQTAGFRPMATVHGINLTERLNNVEQLHQIGYKHFALGGLAAKASQKKVLLETIQVLSDRIRHLEPTATIHVLGLSSPDYYAAFNQMGIDSCDGSSHFKQAFTAGVFFGFEHGQLVKHQASKGAESTNIPDCSCTACTKMRSDGIDTRYYGSNESNMGRAAHNLNMLMLAHSHVSKSPEITLVSCVGQKLNQPSQARFIYQSPWFTKCKNYVESQNYNWFILSAKYGLIKPQQVIEPYEESLNSAPAQERQQWSKQVFASIVEILPKGGTIRFFAGEKYRQYLIPLLEEAGYKTEVPLQGLGIGQQLQWFDNHGADELNYISIDEEDMELNPDKLSTNLLLNFPSLRDKCLQHIQEAYQRCHCGQKFSNPDSDWLKAEFSKIFDSLESDDAIYDYNDLVNAFYSVVFELEYGQKLYPNTLIKYGNDIYRIIAFYDKYPIRVKMLRYKKHSNGQLAKYQSWTYLHRPVQRILLIDPLSRITY